MVLIGGLGSLQHGQALPSQERTLHAGDPFTHSQFSPHLASLVGTGCWWRQNPTELPNPTSRGPLIHGRGWQVRGGGRGEALEDTTHPPLGGLRL